MPASFAKSTILNAMGSVAIIAGGFLTTVIVARLLGPEAVGVVAYAAFVVGLSLAVLDMGIPGTLTRFFPEFEEEGRHDQTAALARFLFVPYALVSLLYAAALIWLLDPASFGLSGNAAAPVTVVAIVAGAVMAQSLAAFHYGALKGSRHFHGFARLTIFSALLQLAVAAAGSLLFGITGALAAPIAGFVIPAILALRYLRLRSGLPPEIRARAIHYAWRTWGTYFLTAIAWSRMEIYFLKHSWGDHAAGLFAAGLNLANLAFQLPLLLTGALVPFLVLKNKAEGGEQFAQSFTLALRYFALLVFPACLGAAAITPALLPLLYGSSFGDGILPAMILIAGSSAMTFIIIVQQYAFAAERTGVVLWLSALGAGLSILSGLTLTRLYGTEGAAIGRVAAQMVVAGAMLVYAGRIGWRTPYRELAAILAASAVSAGIAGAIVWWSPSAGGIVAAILAAVVAYLGLTLALGLITETDRALLKGYAGAMRLPALKVARAALLRR